MSSGARDTTQLVPGSPIRTPWDHSLVDSSPRPIAASHVLHRLLVPRHSPSALGNLTTTIMTHRQPPTPERAQDHRKEDARVHCAILNQRPPPTPRHHTRDATT